MARQKRGAPDAKAKNRAGAAADQNPDQHDDAAQAAGPGDAGDAGAAEPKASTSAPKARKKHGAPKGTVNNPTGKRRSSTSRHNTAAYKKALEATDYRALGYTFRQIAEFLGYNTPQAVHMAIKTVMAKESQEAADETLALYRERLERLFQVAMNAASTGDNFAVESALKVMDRIERMHGFNKPTKVAATTPDGEEAAPSADAWRAFLATGDKDD